MKLKKLSINRLYGNVDYSIKFNSDLTFLYGDNGCGKTTVLDIITSIITGKIYDLFKYRFESIVLKYMAPHTRALKEISIRRKEDENFVIVKYNGEEYDINIQKVKIMADQLDDSIDLENACFDDYKFLKDINKEFSYIYLPLSRNGSINDEANFHFKKYARFHKRMIYYSDITLNDVSMLIKDSYNRINNDLSQINEKFNEELLKYFLDAENISNIQDLVITLNKLNPVEIVKIKNEYTKVLKTIRKWDETTERKIESFFDSLLNIIFVRVYYLRLN